MQVSGNSYHTYGYQQSTTHRPTTFETEKASNHSGKVENNARTQAKTAASTLSNAVQAVLIGLQEAEETEKPGHSAVLDTNKGRTEFDLDSYYSDNPPPPSGERLIDNLPPLILPSAENIQAISEHASTQFKSLLAQNGIPSAPSEITFDREGKLQLPADYPYADELKQALEENPGLKRELRDLSATSSHYAEIQKRLPFYAEYSSAGAGGVDRVINKYSHLFENNGSYTRIALNFSGSGELSITADGKSLPIV